MQTVATSKTYIVDCLYIEQGNLIHMVQLLKEKK